MKACLPLALWNHFFWGFRNHRLRCNHDHRLWTSMRHFTKAPIRNKRKKEICVKKTNDWSELMRFQMTLNFNKKKPVSMQRKFFIALFICPTKAGQWTVKHVAFFFVSFYFWTWTRFNPFRNLKLSRRRDLWHIFMSSKPFRRKTCSRMKKKCSKILLFKLKVHLAACAQVFWFPTFHSTSLNREPVHNGCAMFDCLRWGVLTAILRIFRKFQRNNFILLTASDEAHKTRKNVIEDEKISCYSLEIDLFGHFMFLFLILNYITTQYF